VPSGVCPPSHDGAWFSTEPPPREITDDQKTFLGWSPANHPPEVVDGETFTLWCRPSDMRPGSYAIVPPRDRGISWWQVGLGILAGVIVYRLVKRDEGKGQEVM
jgi:hypothetical protein